MPEFHWRIAGPVKNLGIFNSFQPDSRTLESIGNSLRKMIIKRKEKEFEENLALTIEEYVNLLMEGYLPEYFDNRIYVSRGRVIREGRGWCANYALAIHALAVESGLEATMLNTRGHVMGEVRGKQLKPIVLDALLQVGVCSSKGERTSLKIIETPQKRILGLGVNNKTRRGTGWQYYDEITNYNENWTNRKSEIYRNGLHPSS